MGWILSPAGRGALSIGRQLVVRVRAAMIQSATYSRPNMRLFALFAVIAHPVYFLCWTLISPQPFESAWLRMFSVLVALPMLFESQLSRNQIWHRYFTLYWFAVLLYQLPFFFVFMSLMNGFSDVWALSTMAACLFTVLLVFDWLMVTLMVVTGVLLACLGYTLFGTVDFDAHNSLTRLVPVYLFALVGGSAFNYKAEIVAREKLGAITSAVGTIAHELRTPLLSIRSGARGLQTYLPALFEAYGLARDHGLPITPRIVACDIDLVQPGNERRCSSMRGIPVPQRHGPAQPDGHDGHDAEQRVYPCPGAGYCPPGKTQLYDRADRQTAAKQDGRKCPESNHSRLSCPERM